MASRLKWVVVGASIGAWATLKVQSEFRSKIQASKPNNVVARVEKGARRVADSVIDAAQQGFQVAVVELERLKDSETY